MTSYYPGFTSATTLDANMEYGIGWAVAFVEALKDAGRNFTRASFLKTLTSKTFTQTPSLLPLRYTAGDHQGLNGGELVSVTSATSWSPITGTVYSGNSAASGPVTVTAKSSATIPSWLK
jgi:hypothetical protein